MIHSPDRHVHFPLGHFLIGQHVMLWLALICQLLLAKLRALHLCRSTAIEVALKMAFRKFLADRPDLLAGMQAAEETGSLRPALGVLGLANAYHGDTLGTMDAVAPSPYNGLQQTPWYPPPSLSCWSAHLFLRQQVRSVYLRMGLAEHLGNHSSRHLGQRAPMAGHAPFRPLHQSFHCTTPYQAG